MIRTFKCRVFVLLIATSTALACHTAKSDTVGINAGISRFNHLSLVKGMSRTEAEAQIAGLLGTANTYSAYGNNLFGGVVTYRDGDWILKITYKAGSPAPMIRSQDGNAQGYPPIDETVIDYVVEKMP